MDQFAPGSLSLLLAGIGLWLLRPGWRALRGTTLRAAWCWALLSIVAVGATEAGIAFAAAGDDPRAEMVRFAAAVLVFSATMAVLGAKRPQHTAWQFVVITLWGVLALPALETWLRGRGEEFAVDPVRSWFFVVLIAVGAVNHLPTRFGVAAAQLAAAQTLLLWPHLPWGGWSAAHPPVWAALLLLVTAAATVRREGRRRRSAVSTAGSADDFGDWSRVWREFHDWFGAVWSVRVMERMNASAAMYGWPVVLGWDGFAWRDEALQNGSSAEMTPDRRQTIEQALRTLLRRFVSPEWIDERLRVRV